MEHLHYLDNVIQCLRLQAGERHIHSQRLCHLSYILYKRQQCNSPYITNICLLISVTFIKMKMSHSLQRSRETR